MSRERIVRPANWPEMYSAAGRSPTCPHQMQWDDSDGTYRCIYDCGEVDEYPPGRSLEAANSRGGDA